MFGLSWTRRALRKAHVAWLDHGFGGVVLWGPGSTAYLPRLVVNNPEPWLTKIALTSRGAIDGFQFPDDVTEPHQRLAIFLKAHATPPTSVEPEMKPVFAVPLVGMLTGRPTDEVDVVPLDNLFATGSRRVVVKF